MGMGQANTRACGPLFLPAGGPPIAGLGQPPARKAAGNGLDVLAHRGSETWQAPYLPEGRSEQSRASLSQSESTGSIKRSTGTGAAGEPCCLFVICKLPWAYEPGWSACRREENNQPLQYMWHRPVD